MKRNYQQHKQEGGGATPSGRFLQPKPAVQKSQGAKRSRQTTLRAFLSIETPHAATVRAMWRSDAVCLFKLPIVQRHACPLHGPFLASGNTKRGRTQRPGCMAVHSAAGIRKFQVGHATLAQQAGGALDSLSMLAGFAGMHVGLCLRLMPACMLHGPAGIFLALHCISFLAALSCRNMLNQASSHPRSLRGKVRLWGRPGKVPDAFYP